MPALITHHLFGEESIDRLPQGVITSDEERIAFILGNQGPDPFFFHMLTPRISDCMSLAQVMHRSRMSRQFSCLRDGVSHLQPRDANLGRAFALGLLSHYVLDRNAHPFVYEQQFGIVSGAAADVEDARYAFGNVVSQKLRVKLLCFRQVREGDRQIVRPEAVVQMVGLEQIATEDVGNAQPELLRVRIFALFHRENIVGHDRFSFSLSSEKQYGTRREQIFTVSVVRERRFPKSAAENRRC